MLYSISLIIYDFAVFFIMLTAVNILNLVMFRVSSIAAQSSAACLGQAVTMIMSQRIILGLHDWRTAVIPSSGHGNAYELSQGKGRGTSNIHVLGRTTVGGESNGAISTPNSGYTPSSSAPLKSFVPDMRRSIGGTGEPVVHVHVEQDVKADYDSFYTPSSGYPPHSVRHSRVFYCHLIFTDTHFE